MGRWQSLVAYWGMGALMLLYTAATVTVVVLLASITGYILDWGLGLANIPHDFRNRILYWSVLLIVVIFVPYVFSIVLRKLGVVPATIPKPFRLPQSAADASQTSRDARP